MQWDISEGKESEYYDFVVNEFIPRLQQLGLNDLQFWYTTYGEAEQIQASGIVPTKEQANTIINSEEWEDLTLQLSDLVEDFDQKAIPATNGFQL